jgi:hypothetical protein
VPPKLSLDGHLKEQKYGIDNTISHLGGGIMELIYQHLVSNK